MTMNCRSDLSCKSKCLKIALLVVLGVAALGWLVMLLWNWLLPELFLGAQPVSYAQALGILLLSKILFGGFRGGCHGRWKEGRGQGEHLTQEEREQLKSEFKSRWGNWCKASKSDPAPKGSAPEQE